MESLAPYLDAASRLELGCGDLAGGEPSLDDEEDSARRSRFGARLVG